MIGKKSPDTEPPLKFTPGLTINGTIALAGSLEDRHNFESTMRKR